MINFAIKFLATLSDEELEYFGSRLWAEKDRRYEEKRKQFPNGLPELNDEEKHLADSGLKIEAIKAYRTRVGHPLKECMRKVEDYKNSIR